MSSPPLSSLLHQYQAHAAGGVSVSLRRRLTWRQDGPSFFAMFPVVFITLVALQEFAGLWRNVLFSVGFSAICEYWALQLAFDDMFASLYNFMYPGTLLVLGSLALVIGWPVKKGISYVVGRGVMGALGLEVVRVVKSRRLSLCGPSALVAAIFFLMWHVLSLTQWDAADVIRIGQSPDVLNTTLPRLLMSAEKQSSFSVVIFPLSAGACV